MNYEIEFSENALSHILHLKKSGEIQTLKKIDTLLLELEKHPKIGTGKPEKLKGNLWGKWSRRITQRHRLIYEIFEETVKVTILSSYGHYNDK